MLVIEFLSQGSHCKEFVLYNHVKHVFVHYGMIIGLDILECVSNYRNKKVD